MDKETISSNIVLAIKELSYDYERWDNEEKQFVMTDDMKYLRKIFLEKLLDGTFYLHFGKTGNSSEAYAKRKSDEAAIAYRNRTGEEISNNELRGALGASRSANHKHEALAEIYADLQSQYNQEFGDYYKPYMSPPTYYYGTQNVLADETLPDDIRQELEALGMLEDSANDILVDDTPKKKKA